MRKLKLQMMMTLDGFVAGPNGELDWFKGPEDERVLDYINELTDSSDTILMGRKMTPGFISYWEGVVDHQPGSPEFSFAKKMVDTKKIVFSKTWKNVEGRNAEVENGDLVTSINTLKSKPGKDIIAYGGAAFAASLIDHQLVDELYLFVNPVTLGKGLSIFSGRKTFRLAKSTAYTHGVVLNLLLPETNR